MSQSRKMKPSGGGCKNMKIFFLFIGLILLVHFSCSNDSEGSSLEPSLQCPLTNEVASQGALPDLNYDTGSISSSNLVVMTRNLYLGADISKLLEITDLVSLATTVSNLYTDLIASQFIRRARGLAREIAQLKPDVIALQEVEEVYTGYPNYINDPVNNADCLEINFLDILIEALSEQNVAYQVAIKTKNADIELTDLNKDVRIIDYDVILVREGLAFSGSKSQAFQSQLQISMDKIPGAGVATILRSYSEIQLSVNNQTIYLVNTHLEVEPTIQLQQANELIVHLQELGEKGNVILAGDLNSMLGISGNSYANILAAGFLDAYAGPQLSCCYQSLNDDESSLMARVDHILYKPFGASIETNGVIFTGINSEEKVFTIEGEQIWPSDHAGVTAGFTISP